MWIFQPRSISRPIINNGGRGGSQAGRGNHSNSINGKGQSPCDSVFAEDLSGRVCWFSFFFLTEPFFSSPCKWERRSDITLLTAWGAARSPRWAPCSASTWERVLEQGNVSSSPLRHQAGFLGKPYWWRNY